VTGVILGMFRARTDYAVEVGRPRGVVGEAQHHGRCDTTNAVAKMATKACMEKWLLGLLYSLVALFVLFFVSLYVAWSVAWPVPSLMRVSHITCIRFPPGSVLVAGYDRNCGPSELVGAKVRVPASAVPAFLASPNIWNLTKTYNGRVDPARYPELAGHGWNLIHIHHFCQASFSDGSISQILVDLDDPQWATVYADYDEP